MLAPARRSFRFGLRTLFALLTLTAIGLGLLAWHLHWIRERREARQWLGARDLGASILNRQEAHRELPWGLRVLGESPLTECVIGANHDDRTDLAAFRRRVEAIRKLFPECYLINVENNN